MLLLCYIVVNESVVVFVGEPVTVREDVRVTINCSNVIQQARDAGFTNPNITWYKDGFVLTNATAPNVVISEDKTLCIITDTLLAVGGQVGNDGNYTCEVCAGTSSNCIRPIPPCIAVCGE